MDQDSPFEQYSRALYWSMTTITTIGYGDVTPIRVGEILFTIMAEFIGILIFALLVDKVVQLSEVLDRDRESNHAKNEVVQFMQRSNFEQDFRDRVLEYMNFRAASSSLGTASSFSEDDGRFKVLSPSLLAEMRCRIFRPILRKVKIFGAANDVPEDFIDALTKSIQSTPFAPQDEIVGVGEYGKSLYIVLSGQVAISSSGRKHRLIMADDDEPIFGVCAAMDKQEWIKARRKVHSWSAEAISYCDIAEIDHESIAASLAVTWPSGMKWMHRIARAEMLAKDGIDAEEKLGEEIGATIWVGGIPESVATQVQLTRIF